ncbi:hypothetical protein EHQ23_16195 [Leptospira bourretii]|uniref:DUF4129 domain-containing protein n=1 Tax=Leptospira bourretii TaxID=2484962 RepID=A0A4R9ISI7_9LEPT|nr:hypothetical protein [Leptospira bourretii]TGK82829.1 hypothetical protein EHQ23_16195 [Leptospira bourretii]TGK94175.1 hypothetical protein EHQ26_04015 [Leptospira bourretii]TGL28053.1 hypothetical protein EHQ45_17030 [Leptospira bourretii]
MAKYILLVLISTFSLYATPKETIQEEEIFVGDTVHYQIELSEGIENDLQMEEGDFYEDSTMPSFKIFNIKKDKIKLSAIILFYKPGNFILPISWKENGEEKKSTKQIKVKSQLLGSEKDIEDSEPPISFSGPYLFRLFLVLLITVINLYLLYALYLYWKSKPKVVDALWEKQPVLEETIKRLHVIETYLESESIYEKELAFKISEYAKEVYSKRLEKNLLGNTDSEFLAELFDRTHIEESILRNLRVYFRNTKYDNNQTKLKKEEALSVWEKIKKDMEL